MKDLLESLDSTVFTPELKANIQAKFASKLTEIEDSYKNQLTESATKVTELEAALVEATEKLEESISAVEVKAEEYAELIKEDVEAKAEAFGKYVTEQIEAKAEAYVDLVKKELNETVSSYLDKVVETFVETNRLVVEDAVQVEKTKSLLEGLDSIIYTAGRSVVEINESVQAEKPKDGVAELKAKIDSLIKENAELKSSSKAKEKESILESVAKDLTLVQRDRFDRLAKVITESDSTIYKLSLEKIKEEILDKVETVITEKVEDSSAKPAHKRFF